MLVAHLHKIQPKPQTFSYYNIFDRKMMRFIGSYYAKVKETKSKTLILSQCHSMLVPFILQ